MTWPCLSQRHPLRRGVTLTEVVTGLALLGTLLAGTLIAVGRLERQRRRSVDKLAAVAILDEIVERFEHTQFPIPGAEGSVAGHATWRWRVRERTEAALAEEQTVLEIGIVDLKGMPVARLELVVPRAAIAKPPSALGQVAP